MHDRLDKYGWYRMMGCHWFYVFVILLGLLSTAFIYTGYGLNKVIEAVGLARNTTTLVTRTGSQPRHYMEVGDIDEGTVALS